MESDITARNTLRNIVDGTRFLKLPLPLPEGLSCVDVFMLAYLVQYSYLKERYAEMELREFDGWFIRTVSHITKETGIQKRHQTRILTRLQEKGFITFEKHGIETRRRIIIHCEEVLKLYNRTTENEA